MSRARASAAASESSSRLREARQAFVEVVGAQVDVRHQRSEHGVAVGDGIAGAVVALLDHLAASARRGHGYRTALRR
jgi:hypothetical protein